ncbi:NADH-ubiquinone oxidoreductase-F iron-sulfur binding region domain-containing protein [Candidatus Mycolicibacterium alkanivorans]|uniref:NADH-quinone oxidoreductase subunit F n=1 Tax=Candidatus Mycolicibacterium alkanivorans TaxID=2954114 RepID=A0ABS9YQE7_9MYCO|nr:NADH-ubiquinone oxidoreductase-F iron-sulfur binding region domain-containing protein [Candidatus Mycolicibacterium alkanivorans]MCI4673500.1 NADH-quinone oxidoreductase subunit F [Candidatus Mycolicibacterium alkanivorans]
MNTAPTMPRLLAANGRTLADHHERFGLMPAVDGPGLIAAIDEAGLSGRGGAGFPAGIKLAAVSGPKPVVVGNAAEGEPLSRKDALLIKRAPQLVLDGLEAVATAVNADKVFLYLHPDAVPAATKALEERRAAGLDPHNITLVEAPDKFVAGEESAAIRRIEGGPALPRDRVVIAAVSGVRGRPTLVNNIETLAHVALIARYGAEWFRSVGDQDDPGTMLVTLSGAFDHHGVVEVPTGTLLTDLISHHGGTDPRNVSAILVGGYHGTWLPANTFGGTKLSRTGLKHLGATPGAGIIHALGTTECGLVRSAEIVGYLADEGARQCGPCKKGLPRLAELLDELAYGRANDPLVKEIRRMVRLVDGRGACRHPDGTARLVRSALRAFATDIEAHHHARCAAADVLVHESRPQSPRG